MVTIDTSSNSEILLYIPAELRYRAKSIGNCWWDHIRKAWVFPKDRVFYDALCREFSNELNQLNSNIPKQVNHHAPDYIVRELRDEIRQLSQALQSSVSLSDYRELEATKNKIAKNLQDENERLKKEVEKIVSNQNSVSESNIKTNLRVQSSYPSKMIELNNLKEENEKLQNEIQSLKIQINNQKNELESMYSEEGVFNFVKDIVLNSTDNEKVVSVLFKRLTLDNKYLPLEVGKLVEHSVRQLAGVDDEYSFHDAINKARDMKLINDETLSLAHSIRKQRNIVAHDVVDEQEAMCRSLYILSAFALYWRKLPKM